MKALTLWQPWASLVAFGEKKIETRCWSTKYRGELAIHAAQKEVTILGQSRNRQEFHREMCRLTAKWEWGDGYWPGVPHYQSMGCVLCIVKLVDVLPCEHVRDDLSEQELIFGNYEDGRYAWFLEMVEKFEKPIPAKGNRRLWEWNRDAARTGA